MRFGAFSRKTFRVERMLDFPSTLRNREDIGAALEETFDVREPLRVLELASGSGQHVVYFAARFPLWTFQPTDLEPEHLESIEAYRRTGGTPNVSAPLLLDVSSREWPVDGTFDAVWAINLIHIAPWEATLGLFSGARKVLAHGGRIYLYGAYRREGRHTAPSNEQFDRSLKQRNPAWGVRCLNEVAVLAREHRFALKRVTEMPSNNLSVVFEKEL